MKPIIPFVYLFVFICLDRVVFADDLVARDFAKAREYAESHFPVLIDGEKGLWKFIDIEGKISRRSYSNMNFARSAKVYYSISKKGTGILIVDDTRNRTMPNPEGFNLVFLVSKNAAKVITIKLDRPDERYTRLYNPENGEFISDFSEYCSFNDKYMINETVEQPGKRHVATIFDLATGKSRSYPLHKDGKNIRFRDFSEGIICGDYRNAGHVISVAFGEGGETLFELPGYSLGPFNDERAVARIYSSNNNIKNAIEYMVVDTRGNVVFQRPGVERISNFSDGLAVFVQKDEKNSRLRGYINTSGEVVIPAKYSRATTFINGKAFVREPRTTKEGYFTESNVFQIDKEGNVLEEFDFGRDHLSSFFNGIGFSMTDYEFDKGLYDLHGNCIWQTDDAEALRRMRVFYGNNEF